MRGSSDYDHFDIWCYMGDLPEFLRNERNENYVLCDMRLCSFAHRFIHNFGSSQPNCTMLYTRRLYVISI